MQCSVTWWSEVRGGQAPALAVWRQRHEMAQSWGPVWPWQLRLPTVMHPAGRGQGLSPAVGTPIRFHGSSLICRICHCRGGLLLGVLTMLPWFTDSKPPSWILYPLSLCLYHSTSLSAVCLPCHSISVSSQFVCEHALTWEAGCWSKGGKRLLFVWPDAQGHLWTSVSDQRSWWCRTDSWAMSYQPLLRPSSIILSPRPSHSDDGTLNKLN